MSHRSLLWILIVLALSIAPLGIHNGAMAMATTPDQHSQAMQNGHCDDQAPSHHDGKASEKSCCIAMCTAITGVLNSEMSSLEPVQSSGSPALEPILHDFLAKLPTPPPRAA